jgi:hypothetical protein
MIQITQRQINHGMFGLMTLSAIVSLGVYLIREPTSLVIFSAALYCLICFGLRGLLIESTACPSSLLQGP